MTGIGMRILGHNFKSAPRPAKPTGGRNVADLSDRAATEKARAAARREALRKITSAVGKT
jgi:hypothetical protein